MSRPLAAALMGLPAIVALVGNRRALKQLKPGTAMPALVYTIVDIDPSAYLDDPGGYEAMRIQVNPMAETINGVQQIHDAVRGELDGMGQATLASRRVIAIRRDIEGPEDSFTDDAGKVIWTRPRDYIVVFD